MLKKIANIRCSRKAMMVLILVAALTVSGTSTALAANGGNFILGASNTATAITSLYANFNGQALVVNNPNTGSVATALRLIVPSSRPPMIVNSSTKVANLNADLLDGKDSSAFAPVSGLQAQQVIEEYRGPLPVQNTYTSKGGTLLITFSGTGYRSGVDAQFPGQIKLELYVDGSFAAESPFYTNELSSHRTFPTISVPLSGLAAGPHTIRLKAAYESSCNTSNEASYASTCTTTDNNDIFYASVLEIPNATSAAAASKTAEPTATKASKKHHAARHHKKHKNKA